MKPSALLLLAPGFEEIEAITPIDILRRASFDVTSLSTISGPLLASRGTRHLADQSLDAYPGSLADVLILPGGVEGTKNLADDPRVHKIILDHYQNGKWIAAICAAPTILMNLNLLKNHPFCAHPSLHESLANTFLQANSRVVVSKPFITSLAAGSSLEFSYEIIRQILGEAEVQKVDQGVRALQ